MLTLLQWQKDFMKSLNKRDRILIFNPRIIGGKSFYTSLKKYHPDLYKKYFPNK